jgi:uncharacterized spore protein YtfJ
MDPQQILSSAQEAISVRRVFGDPIQAGEVTLLPVAVVAGGGGGGVKQADESGVGFGLSARPAGVFAVRNGEVRWRPAVNVNRAILGGQLVGIAAIGVVGSLIRLWISRRVRSVDASTTDARTAVDRPVHA